jgi:hypothetical protein
MDHQTANKLDRLLAGDAISGPEADAIFERVIAGVEREERAEHNDRRPHWRRALWGTGLIAIAAAGVLVALRTTGPATSELRVRGASGAGPGPRLQLICSGGRPDACPISSQLIFAVSGDATSGFLSAYAEPLEPGAERVWYFSRDGDSPVLDGVRDGTRVFERAVRLAGTHQTGRYRVHVFLSDVALTPAEMLAGTSAVIARAQAELQIIGE